MTTATRPHLRGTPDEVQAIQAQAPWCTDDHSEPAPARVDFSCCAVSHGVEMPFSFDGDPKVGGEALFAFLAVHPFWDEQDGHEVPHVSLQLVDGVWLPTLGPEELADVIAKLRDHATTSGPGGTASRARRACRRRNRCGSVCAVPAARAWAVEQGGLGGGAGGSIAERDACAVGAHEAQKVHRPVFVYGRSEPAVADLVLDCTSVHDYVTSEA